MLEGLRSADSEVSFVARVFHWFYLAGSMLLILKIFVMSSNRFIDPITGIGIALCLVPILIYPLRVLQCAIMKACQSEFEIISKRF